MPATSHGQQRGFSLAEMLIAMVIASLMMTAISQALAPALAFYGKQETASRLADLRLAIEAAYKDDSKLIDAQETAVFTLSAGTISPVLADANGRCPSTPASFAALGPYLSTSANVSALDGFSQGVCIFITPRLSWSSNGVSYYYHSIAVVSPGYDGAVDALTGLSSNGSLTLGGDDKGILLDGRRLVGTLVDVAVSQINRASSALSSYFTTRYQSNPTRDIGVNYFARTNRAGNVSANFDSTGSMPNTGGSRASMTSINAHSVLGLAVADVTDPWGTVLSLDNSSDAVRNPENTTTSLRAPGYTARISTTLPGGAVLERTVVGTY